MCAYLTRHFVPNTHLAPRMASAGGAYGASRASDTDFRKKWDKEEYAEKARKKDEDERDRMKENEERMRQGMLTLHFAHCSFPNHRQERSLEKRAKMISQSPLSI